VVGRNLERLRSTFSSKGIEHEVWNPVSEKFPKKVIEKSQVIVNLSGESIGEKRWSSEVKRKIFDSRVLGTRNLVQSINEAKKKPELLINSSAIGYYGDRGDDLLTERSHPGRGFLSEVCQAWENEARQAQIRTVIVRTGVVLHPDGGVLKKMLPPFKAGLGGPLGDGKQWMSWIAMEDLIGIMVESIVNKELKSEVNAVADRIQNKDFVRELASALHRKAVFTIPAWILKAVLGEMSNLLLQSQRVRPSKLVQAGFKFKHPTLRSCLDNYFGPR
jgi:uncharacterized protein